MGKKAPRDEPPFRPLLEPDVVSSVLVRSASTAPPPPELREESKLIEMPRPVETKPAPSPSVRGTLATAPAEPSAAPAAVPLVAKFDHEKRILFTRAESQAIDRMTTALATRLGAQVKVSHIMRAMVALLLNAERELDRRAGEKGTLIRPANGDTKALQRFERDIASIIGDALRDAGPLR